MQLPYAHPRKFLEETVCSGSHGLLLGAADSISVQMCHSGAVSQAPWSHVLEWLRCGQTFGGGPDSTYVRCMVSAGPCGLRNNYRTLLLRHRACPWRSERA